MTGTAIGVDAILRFWFGSAREDAAALAAMNRVWFASDPDFDRQVRERFGTHLERAAAGELKRWKLSAEGTLALIITFDQFPRNIFRSMPQAFAFDSRALALCRDGVAMKTDRELGIVERAFFYMPLEHAEDAEAQERSVACFEQLHADAPGAFSAITALHLRHAREHRDLIHRFGRFPHRNLVLGRASTPEEIAWIAGHRGAFGQG